MRHAARSRAEWREEVIGWRSSGKTATEYAAQRGLHPKTLTLWGSRLRNELPSRAKAPRQIGTGFLPVRVVGARDSATTGSAAVVREFGQFELALNNGRRVRVCNEFESEALSRLLKLVEGI